MTTETAKAKKISVKSLTKDVKGKAQTAYAKGSSVAGEIGTMSKSNIQAVVASGKILSAGLKELGQGSVAESKQAVETLVTDLKAVAAVKSPKELVNLQIKVAKRNLDTAIAFGSKNRKAIGKLASDTVAPISSQVKANVAKLRAAA